MVYLPGFEITGYFWMSLFYIHPAQINPKLFLSALVKGIARLKIKPRLILPNLY